MYHINKTISKDRQIVFAKIVCTFINYIYKVFITYIIKIETSPQTLSGQYMISGEQLSMNSLMTKEECFFIHSKHVKRACILFVVGWIFPIIKLIKDTTLSWHYFIIPLIFLLIAIMMDLRRRHIIRKLLNIKLNFRKVYEIKKHKSKNNLYNLRWDMIIAFFDGDFQIAILYANKILSLTSRKKLRNSAIFYIILSYFLTGNNFDALSLIKASPHRKNKLFYEFIEAYISERYDEAIEVMQKLLNKKAKNIEIVLANYFMRMAFLKKSDSDNAQNCIVEILVADKERNTYFSKNARSN